MLVILLLTVMEVFSIGAGAIYRILWSSNECAICACDHIVHLSVPSIGFIYVLVCLKLSLHLRV